MTQSFDRFLIHVGIGTNRKLRRLPVVQRWTYVAGVLSLAAQSPMRGALLITDGAPATAQDVAEEATVAVRDARAALDAFRKLGMLSQDEHGIEWVHDWDRLNPDPKPSASPEATRARKRRQRAKAREGHADVTRDNGVTSGVTTIGCHDPEVEVEVEELQPPIPLRGNGVTFPVAPQGRRGREHREHDLEVSAWVAEHFPQANARKARALAELLRARGIEPTPQAMREYGRGDASWSLDSAGAS